MNTLLIPLPTAEIQVQREGLISRPPAFDAISAAYAAFEAGDIARAVRLLAWSPTAATGDDNHVTGTGDADNTSSDTPTVALPRPAAATLPSASSTRTVPSEIPEVCCRCSLALSRRARRRARACELRSYGVDVVTLDRALLNAAYVALANVGGDAPDVAIARAWIAALELLVPRHVPWPASLGHMKDALARVGGDTGRAMALHECASNMWSRPADAAFEAGQVAA